jgi:hypothetical protein
MTDENTNETSSTSETSAAAANDSEGADMLTRLKSRLKKVIIKDDGVEEEFYRVEGDLLLDEDQLEIYALQREALEKEQALRKERAALGTVDVAPQEGRSRLVGVTVNGKIVRWKQGMVLTYCVLKNTFNTEQDYDIVVSSMKQATWAWESVCGIRFEHKPELDTSATTKPQGVVFTVRAIDAGGEFIAAAFFPNDPKNRRRVLIDPSFFADDLGFDRVGVLRHELGHVLGFRHEHIRSEAPPDCPDEDTTNTMDLTPYDPQSVMHYFCGEVGDRNLMITEVDKIGSQKLYGLPFDSYTYVE